MRRGYERSSRWALAPPAAGPRARRRHGRAQRLPLRGRAQGVLPAAGHRAAHRRDPGRAGHLVPGHAAEARRRSSASCRTIPAVDNVIGFTGGGWRRRHREHRAHVHRAQAARGARRLGADQVIARLRGRARRVPGAPTFLQAVQDLRVGGRAEQRAVPVHAPGRKRRGARRLGAARRCSACATLPQLVDVSSDQQDTGLPGLAGDRPRHRRRGSASRRSSSTTRSTTPSASARSRPCTRR